MRKVGICVLALIILAASFNLNVKAKDAEPTVSADSAVLMDAETGTILYSKNPDTAYPPASTTKTMTALLTLENSNLNDKITVSKNAANIDGSRIGLQDGEQLTVKDVLYGLFLMSGNDCATALAEHVGGSVENFAKLMNARAKELGCQNTSFVNPSGLYNEKHKTSAKDLALIVRELSKHPEFKEISTTLAYKITDATKHPTGIYLGNENKLINKNSSLYYPGAEGGKTGYTIQSLHSYVAVASKNGQKLIVALVHDKNKTFYEDSAKLFNYGFNNYELVKYFGKSENVTTYSSNNIKVPLEAADDFYFIREKGSKVTPTYSLINENLANKSFKAGDAVMKANILLDNRNIGILKLDSSIDHQIKPLLNSSPSQANRRVMDYAIAGVAIGLIAIFILARSLRLKSRKSRELFK